MAEYSILGKPTPRDEAVPKAKGETKFSVDIARPGMLWGKLLTSPHPHARIVSINTDKARLLKGVKAILVGTDLPDRVKLPPLGPPLAGDQHGIARDIVRYIGEPVAAVAAVDEDTAQEALDLIDVEYEPLPAVFDAVEAMSPGAVRIHKHTENNIPATSFNEYGDIEKGFAESDHIREDTFKFNRIAYTHPEPQNAVADYDAFSGKLTIWAPAQSATALRKLLAHLLDMPWTKVRVLSPFIGGGFGGRSFISSVYVAAAALSRLTQRPVKIVTSREEDIILDWMARHDTIVQLKTGVKKDGTLMARDATVIYDTGAYKITMQGPQPQAYAACMHVPYTVRNLRLKGMAVYTNKQPVGPFRGYGQYPTLWSCDFQMDLFARDLGLDRMDIRLKNTVRPDTVTPLGFTVGTCGVNQCLEGVGKSIGWPDSNKSHPDGRGKGLSTSWFASPTWGGSPSNPLASLVRINTDGTADLMLVGTDSGSGQYSTLCMMVAEELGIPLADVRRETGDTENFPNEEAGLFTVTVASYGEPVKLATINARQEVLEQVADKLEANIQDLLCKNGRVYVKGSPERGMPFAEAARLAIAAKGQIIGRGESVQWGYKKFGVQGMEERYVKYSFPGTAPGMSFGAAGADVEVDRETGQVHVRRLAHAYDVGFAVNPLGVMTQLEGSAGQSMGGLVTEEVIFQDGRVLNASHIDYRIPSALDVPEIVPIIVEHQDSREGERGAGAYGAKELGMGALCASGAAVVSAICDATGLTLNELPATPERILKALENVEKQPDGLVQTRQVKEGGK